MKKGLIAVLLVLVSTGSVRASSVEELNETIKQRIGIGIYLGITRTPGEILPQESFVDPISDPKLLLTGFVLKYNFAFIFIRSSIDYGFTAFGGKGNHVGTNAAEEYNYSHIHIPVTGGFMFRISSSAFIYMGMGYSYFQGDLEITGDLATSKYEFRDQGTNFLIGTEFGLTESSYLFFEWMHTSGKGVAGSGGVREREIGFSTNQFLVGYNYYFNF